MVAMSAHQLETDSETKERILQRIRNANEEELRSLWIKNSGICTSWAVLLASKIAKDPNDLFFLRTPVIIEWRLQNAAFSSIAMLGSLCNSRMVSRISITALLIL
jgi:hypothetical protein